MRTAKSLYFAILALLLLGSLAAQDKQQLREEKDAARIYQKWLNEDVVYIITDDERKVFEALTTSEEKDRFIEQFWQRRDTDLATAINEYREEHYRRIAHANSKFGTGIPGWKADRGRTYIMFGEPDQIEYNAGGGTYVRPGYEGGGRTATYPFEIWRYRYLEGVGEDIEIEFVDRSWTGEFKVAQWPWEKDMLLHVDGLGLTTAERLGLAKRAQRPGLHPGNLNNTNWMSKNMGARLKDMPFQRMQQYYAIQKPPQIKNKELQEIVETRISYEQLPFDVFIHDVRVAEDQALVPVTLEVANQNLSYQPSGAYLRARVGFYGRITSMLGNVIAEFEDTVASEYKNEHFAIGRQLKSLYQKTFLVSPGRYKIDLVVKDLNSGNLGTKKSSFHVASGSTPQEGLATGSIVLAEQLVPLEELPETPQSFVLGDVRVVPRVSRQFRPSEDLGVYLQVYNPSLDQSTEAPAVSIEYTITSSDRVVSQITDQAGATVNYASEERLVLIQRMPLQNLDKGRYRLTVTVNDRISGQSSHSEADFEVTG